MHESYDNLKARLEKENINLEKRIDAAYDKDNIDIDYISMLNDMIIKNENRIVTYNCQN